MADLLIKRATGTRDLLRRYAVEIDGECAAHVRAGGTTHLTIPEGMRQVRLSIDGYGSEAQTVLASDGCMAILHCSPNYCVPPSKRPRGFPIKIADRLPLDRSSYIMVHSERACDTARAFLRAAWSAARYQVQERTKPSERSRYGLTAGDLSVLFHGCRIADANIVTTCGSANDRLWRALAHINWLASGTVPAVNSGEAVGYRLTKLGQMELLDIFFS